MPKIDWRALPINVVMAWASLFSGAVLGPEGGIGGIASKIAALYGEKVGDPRRAPVAARLLDAGVGLQRPRRQPAVHRRPGHRADRRTRRRRAATCPPTSSAASIGYLIFFAAGSTGLQDYLHLAADESLRADRRRPRRRLRAPRAGPGPASRAACSGSPPPLFGRFEGREVERALAAGVIFSAVGIFAPILLFSGETQIQDGGRGPGDLRAG